MTARTAQQHRRFTLEQGARRANRLSREQMTSPALTWYAVFVLSGKEFIAQKILQRFGCSVYLPMRHKWRRLNRFKKEKSKIAYPAIAGMLFVGFERGQERWFDIFNDVNAVYGVLGTGGHPAALDGSRLATFVNENRSSLDVAPEEKFMRTYHEFRVGDRVLVADGPLEGCVVDVEQIVGENAHILINLLGDTQDIVISLDKLEKAA